VGAERFSLVLFDRHGNYRSCRTNTSCASGTGSFLDQQAVRLGLEKGGVLAELALRNTGAFPLIASRCAVFAKTDLVHAQQAGYRPEEIADGLCRGLASRIADTLFDGDMPEGEMVFCGGVSLNRAVKTHLERIVGRGSSWTTSRTCTAPAAPPCCSWTPSTGAERYASPALTTSSGARSRRGRCTSRPLSSSLPGCLISGACRGTFSGPKRAFSKKGWRWTSTRRCRPGADAA
jgi:hypothetical protein